jgi:hypothetical protein
MSAPVEYTTTELLADLKNRASFRSSGNTFSDNELLTFLDAELQNEVVPLLLSARYDYLVDSEDIAIVANQQAYRIPYRAIGGKLREVAIVDSAGNERSDLPQIQLDHLSPGGWPEPSGFYLKDSKIYLSPVPTSSADSIRAYFYRRPGKLVSVTEEKQCGRITAIDVGAKEVTVSPAAPSNFDTDTRYDFIRNEPGFDTLGYDRTINTFAGGVMTFDDELPSELAIDDWVSVRTTSPIAQIPIEAQSYLAQSTAATVLLALGYAQEATLAKQLSMALKANFLELISPRVDGAVKKIVATSNPLRQGYRSWRR